MARLRSRGPAARRQTRAGTHAGPALTQVLGAVQVRQRRRPGRASPAFVAQRNWLRSGFAYDLSICSAVVPSQVRCVRCVRCAALSRCAMCRVCRVAMCRVRCAALRCAACVVPRVPRRVPAVGLEPTRASAQRYAKPLRLPVPSRRHHIGSGTWYARGPGREPAHTLPRRAPRVRFLWDAASSESREPYRIIAP